VRCRVREGEGEEGGMAGGTDKTNERMEGGRE